MFLPCSCPDTLENFLTKCLSSQCSDHIDSSFFFSDIGNPLKEDVLFLRHVDVARTTALQSGKSCLKVTFDLVSVVLG